MEEFCFTCPQCGTSHDRGFVDGVAMFRCLACGYVGYGFHADAAIDAEVHADHLAGNALNHAAGLPDDPD